MKLFRSWLTRPSWRGRRGVLVAAVLGVVEGGLALAACSSSSPATSVDDDASAEAAPGSRDAALDTASQPPPDAGKKGNCSPVTGDCDIVSQNCPTDSTGKTQECVVTGSGPSARTTCIAVQASQQLQQGHACCPPSAASPNNPCLPGLTCIGNACVDGGAQSGRCAPACCVGDDLSCGNSDPEGIAGACDLVLTSGGSDLYHVCTYSQRCKPFGVEPCGSGSICIVEDQLGSAVCTVSNGTGLGQACKYANDCTDGLFCDTDGDGGLCRMMCLLPFSVHPFDASVEEGGAYAGGCVSGAHCGGNAGALGPFSNLPAWLAFCSWPDGG